MSSILQCLSNTTTIRDHFINDKYRTELNTDNCLGTGGKLAIEFSNILKELWCGDYISCSPQSFKDAVGEFMTEFSGYHQQDSQELLQVSV